jgi:DNA recombination protein RmuC
MTILSIILLLIGLLVGTVIGWLFVSGKQRVLASQLQAAESRIAELGHQLVERASLIERMQREQSQMIEQRSQFQEKASRIPQLEEETRVKQNHISTLNERVSTLEVELAETETTLQKERESSKKELALLDEARKQLTDAFEALSSKALQSNNESFLHLAKATLAQFQESAKGDLEKRQQAILEVVKPVGDSLKKFDDSIRELEKGRVSAYSTLTEQVRNLADGQAMLRSETTNLVRALRAPSTRGRWGEIQLKRVVEMAGMVDHCDFEEQVSMDTETGRQRPDMIIKLPGGKSIVVDAKVPLAAYLEAIESTDDQVRKERMADHARQVRAHVMQLGRKSYWEQFQPTPEFVILFLSGEGFLYAALESDPQLIEFGVNERVILATPTTLIAMLKSIAYGWRQENLEKNAQEISSLGGELYRRLATVGEHFSKLGSNLDKAVRSYNDSVGSLERNVLTTARKLKEHDVPAGDKEVPSLEQIDTNARVLSAPELFPEIEGRLLE